MRSSAIGLSLLSIVLSVAPEQFDSLRVTAPEGFVRSGNRLIKGQSQWVFEAEVSTTNPEEWMRAAIAALGVKNARPTEITHQFARSGVEVWVGGVSGDGPQGVVVFLVLAAWDRATGRLAPTIYQTNSTATYKVEGGVIGKAAGTFLFPAPTRSPAAPAPAPVAPTPLPAAAGDLPDGEYFCSELAMQYVMGRASMSSSPFFIGGKSAVIRLRGDRYELINLGKVGHVARGQRLQFTDGPIAGWLAGTRAVGGKWRFWVRVGGAEDPGSEARVGDVVCIAR